MTPDQTKLIDLITARGLTEQATAAAAGDATAMAAVLADLQNYSVTAEPRLCYAVESGEAATAAGGDHTTLLAVLLSDPNGIMLFQKLSSSAGVMWSHPVTIPYLDWLVSQEKMTTEVRDALVQLSAPTTYPQAEVTAEQVTSAVTATKNAESIRVKNGWLSESNAAADQYVAANPDATAEEIKAAWVARLNEVSA